jgi:uncharacterized membrane protein (DUF2068 family)
MLSCKNKCLEYMFYCKSNGTYCPYCTFKRIHMYGSMRNERISSFVNCVATAIFMNTFFIICCFFV